MRICYHGGGFVGFTGAAYFAKAGHDILIFDIDEKVVEKVNKKEIPVYGVSEFLKFNPFTRAGTITATNRWEDIEKESIHIIAVPTERRGDPVLGIVEAAVRKLVDGRARTILIESTISPGFTDLTLNPQAISLIREGSLRYAVCPRRDWFVDPNDDLEMTPRVVGGYDKLSTEEAVRILSIVSRTIHETGYREAEAVKAFENAIFYHSITFGFAFAERYSKHLNSREVLRLQGTHWRLYPLYPSAGVAGYCVPMGLRYLDLPDIKRNDFAVEQRWREGVSAEILSFMLTNKVPRILVYGISEKEKTRVPHFSPAFDIEKFLAKYYERGKQLWVSDPDYTTEEIQEMGFGAAHFSTLVEGIVVLKSDAYLSRILEKSGDNGSRVVYDCVGALSGMRKWFRAYKLIGERL